MKGIFLRIKINEELRGRIKAGSDYYGFNPSWFVIEAIKEKLKKIKKG